MAKKDAVKRDFGRKKMLRYNVPEHIKQVQKVKKVKVDVDLLRYFGDDIDFSQIPDETEIEKKDRLKREEEERLRKAAEQEDSDDWLNG